MSPSQRRNQRYRTCGGEGMKNKAVLLTAVLTGLVFMHRTGFAQQPAAQQPAPELITVVDTDPNTSAMAEARLPVFRVERTLPAAKPQNRIGRGQHYTPVLRGRRKSHAESRVQSFDFVEVRSGRGN